MEQKPHIFRAPEGINLSLGFEDIWDEHPDYPVSEWQLEVRDDSTRLGYWEWVTHQIELWQDEENEKNDESN